ncbi:MAG: hypothetical protein HMLKMBBP_03768 [Planctomycetes bacterium]|nr:hypothetical protein [Planctomycetota bacterium]
MAISALLAAVLAAFTILNRNGAEQRRVGARTASSERVGRVQRPTTNPPAPRIAVPEAPASAPPVALSAGACTIRGLVVASADAEAMGSADVTITVRGGVIASAVTAADGTFEASYDPGGAAADGSDRARVRAVLQDGAASQDVEVNFAGDRRDAFVLLVVGPGAAVDGRAVRADGSPASGAIVRMAHRSASPGGGAKVSDIRAGADGRFTWTGQPGALSLRAMEPAGVFGPSSSLELVPGVRSDVTITVGDQPCDVELRDAEWDVGRPEFRVRVNPGCDAAVGAGAAPIGAVQGASTAGVFRLRVPRSEVPVAVAVSRAGSVPRDLLIDRSAPTVKAPFTLAPRPWADLLFLHADGRAVDGALLAEIETWLPDSDCDSAVQPPLRVGATSADIDWGAKRPSAVLASLDGHHRESSGAGVVRVFGWIPGPSRVRWSGPGLDPSIIDVSLLPKPSQPVIVRLPAMRAVRITLALPPDAGERGAVRRWIGAHAAWGEVGAADRPDSWPHSPAELSRAIEHAARFDRHAPGKQPWRTLLLPQGNTRVLVGRLVHEGGIPGGGHAHGCENCDHEPFPPGAASVADRRWIDVPADAPDVSVPLDLPSSLLAARDTTVRVVVRDRAVRCAGIRVRATPTYQSEVFADGARPDEETAYTDADGIAVLRLLDCSYRVSLSLSRNPRATVYTDATGRAPGDAITLEISEAMTR